MNSRDYNLRLYDMDGCALHGYKAKTSGVSWIIDTNLPWLESQAAEAKAGGYSELCVGYITNRQDYRTNKYNSQLFGSSCAPALPLFQYYFEQHVSCKVLLDPLWTADIYSGNPAGHSYQNTLLEEFGSTLEYPHPEAVFDETKISLAYLHAHRFAHFHPDARTNDIDIYDDNLPILRAVQSFYEKNPQMLPYNTKLKLHHYAGGKDTLLCTIQGTGAIDHNYEWSLRYISAKTRIIEFPTQLDGRDIHTAAQLQQFHEQDCVLHSPYSLRMQVTDAFDVDEFLRFREKEIPHLSDHRLLAEGENGNYTTANNLVGRGLISYDYFNDFVIVNDEGEGEGEDESEELGAVICPAATADELSYAEEATTATLYPALHLVGLEPGSLSYIQSQLGVCESRYLKSKDEDSLNKYIEVLHNNEEYISSICTKNFNFDYAIAKLDKYLQEKIKATDRSFVLFARSSVGEAQKPLIMQEFDLLASEMKNPSHSPDMRYMVLHDFCWKWHLPEELLDQVAPEVEISEQISLSLSSR